LVEAGAAAADPLDNAKGWLEDGIVSAVATTTGGVTRLGLGVTESTGGVYGSTRGVTNSLRDAGGLRAGACAVGPWATPAWAGRVSGKGVGRGVFAS
jgi:hypothetical protein